MTKEVALLDLGMGNLASVERALRRVGAEVSRISQPEEVARARRVVVPGQGHFGGCGDALSPGMREALLQHIAVGRPYLGVCLGMQLLFESSEEAPGERGLAAFAGSVRKLEPIGVDALTERPHKVPHMGWSETRSSLSALSEYFYYVHSYVCVPQDPSLVIAEADYGGRFCAAVQRGNVVAVQFHPEKSGQAGERLLLSYLEERWN